MCIVSPIRGVPISCREPLSLLDKLHELKGESDVELKRVSPEPSGHPRSRFFVPVPTRPGVKTVKCPSLLFPSLPFPSRGLSIYQYVSMYVYILGPIYYHPHFRGDCACSESIQEFRRFSTTRSSIIVTRKACPREWPFLTVLFLFPLPIRV